MLLEGTVLKGGEKGSLVFFNCREMQLGTVDYIRISSEKQDVKRGPRSTRADLLFADFGLLHCLI